MSTPSSSSVLQAAIMTALSADAAFQALVAARIYDDVPRGAIFPYVTLGQSQVKDWSTGTETGEEHILTVHIWSRYGGRREAFEIAAAVRRILHDQSVPVPGYNLINLRQELLETRRDPDGETYHGIIRLRAVVEPAS